MNPTVLPGVPMSEEKLEIPVIEAGWEFVERLARSVPISAAFWLKESHDDARWFLYVASDQFTHESVREAYRRVLEASRDIHNPYFDPFKVNVIPGDDPVTLAALDLRRRYPHISPLPWGGPRFGNLSVEGIYLYPPTETTTVLSPT